MASRGVHGLVQQYWWKPIGILLCLAMPHTVVAGESIPPLLKQSKVLACAQTETVAKAALLKFWEIEGSQRAFPDENMLLGSERTLHAATLDIVLKSLLGTVDRYPSLRDQVERTILKWNYCDVYEEGVFYDLKQTGTEFVRHKSAATSPENWQGFKALGFLGEVDNRFIPHILDLDQQNLRSDYEWLFHRLFREQCFPHPDTSELFDSEEDRLVKTKIVSAETATNEYPHTWDAECIYPREAPELSTKIHLESVPQLVPSLTAKVSLRPVPQLIPRLQTLVKLPKAILVPGLLTNIKINPVPQLVPGLLTAVILEEQAIGVPALSTQVTLVEQPMLVPMLRTQVTLMEQAIPVPELTSQVTLTEQAIDVPDLLSTFILDEIEVTIPELATKVSLDKAKVVKKAPVKMVKKVGGYTGYTGGPAVVGNHAPAGYAQHVVGNGIAPKIQTAPQKFIAPRVVNTPQPVMHPAVVAVPQVVAAPSIVVGKNASLLERVLGSLSGGSNVLIVDKIQLTVNEYNGTVETAISSSDIGTSVTEIANKPALVKELLQTLPLIHKQQPIIEAKSEVKPAKTEVKVSKPTPVKAQASRPSPYLVAPRLQTMLLVSQVTTSNSPKPVQIKSKVSRVKKIKSKKRYVAKKSNKRTKKSNKSSSSLFTYNPYSNGKPSTKEKSVEQLLLEYQQYEERRKKGLPPKKKPVRDKPVNNKVVRLLDVPQLLWEAYWSVPVAVESDVPPLNTELWIVKKTDNKVKVPGLKSKVKIYKKYVTKAVKVPSLGTMIIQQAAAETKTQQRVEPNFEFTGDYFEDEVFEATEVKKAAKKQSSKLPEKKLPDKVFEETLIPEKISEESFSFSNDRLPDHVFEDTLILDDTVSSVTTPTYLSTKAPLPYVIEERFGSDSPKTKAKKTKEKKPEKKLIGLAGNIYLKQSLKNNARGIGGSINRKIIKGSHWFARVGWNYTLEESDDPFSYSWGIGYSDWHPGTFSAQLNNWGPIKPGEGLALEKAVANFGYSVKSDFLKKNKLSLSGAINVPIEGNSSAAVNLRWSPIKNWYVNASVSQPLEGDGTPKWTYGFGYSDWRPNKINLQYSNYGPNEIPYHNYKDNGTWSLSYNWKF